MKRLKEMRTVGFWNANALVAHDEYQIIPIPLCYELHGTAIRRILHGVGQQV